MVELLVVLAIVALLLILGAVAYMRHLQQSLDAQRKAHLEKYRVALEEYFNDRGQYPPAAALQNCGSDDLKPYLTQVLCDPGSKEPYSYYLNATATQYWLYTNFTQVDDPLIAARGCQNGCGPDGDGDGLGDFNYGVSSRQAVTGDGGGAAGDEFGSDVGIQPTCGINSTPFCFANQCGSCCPGFSMRCDGSGTACYSDNSCGI